MKKTIVVRTQFEGMHAWTTIPQDHPAQFLKTPHRHIFYVEIEIEVTHNNRDQEFFEVKRMLDGYIRTWYTKGQWIPDLGNTSCEDIAQNILIAFSALRVCVYEDNQNGACIYSDRI